MKFIIIFLLSGITPFTGLFPQSVQNEGKVTWIIPEDGGTPRDIGRIRMISPNEVHIMAAFEDGEKSILRHPVSRMDMICQNNSGKPVTVTMHIDLSDDGKRTDFDNRPEAGMPLRNFLFIKHEGGGWKQVDGSTSGWIMNISFAAQPGNTEVGLSPWYNYGDYLEFIHSLSRSPFLEKRLTGKTDHNREHWEIVITDPSTDTSAKETIFWHAREHGYETFSSFAMEGLIGFLLSDQAAEFRRKFIFIIHPMTNIDGVAEGFEYRGGYDHPDYRGTYSSAMLYETVDRLKPEYMVAWHNWIAPRDRNVVFYTDGENGAATARAWLRFTQLFPSIRSAGHRWSDENTPLKYNWFGRALSEYNLHQYSMKKYGTSVWGWEMPWWNLTPPEAVKAGADFAKAYLATITEIKAGSVPAAVEMPDMVLPQYEMHEFVIKAHSGQLNPFRDAAIVGEFTSATGKILVTDGFYDGEDTWRIRFVPEETGNWSYLIRGEGLEVLQTGKLTCTPSANHGFIRVHPENPYAFAYSDSLPFFPMGETCYGLHDDSPITPELRTRYLETRRDQSFNFIRMSIGHSHERAQVEPLYWAWGGTPQKPDPDIINPDFFRSLDSVLFEMNDLGMNAELLLLNFYRKPFTDTELWNPTRERLWLRYVLSRYSAFRNIFMWTISNEYETHPDGKYRLDLPGDPDWVKAVSHFIDRNDPYDHLVTVHPVVSASATGASPRDSINLPWRIGEFYGEVKSIDVLSQQTGQSGAGIKWDEKLLCWKGDDPNLTASISADRRYQKPVLNSENGYEYLRGESTSRNQVHHTDKVRHNSWRIVCAGGYFAAGFHGTIGHSDVWNRIDAPNHYTFILDDEGAADQLRILYKFFSRLPYWRMEPFNGLKGNGVALADRTHTYVVYLPKGGEVKLDLSDCNTMTAKWFNPRKDRFLKPRIVKQASDVVFRAPDTNDWVLLLEGGSVLHFPR